MFDADKMPPFPWGDGEPTSGELIRYLAMTANHPAVDQVNRWVAERFNLEEDAA